MMHVFFFPFFKPNMHGDPTKKRRPCSKMAGTCLFLIISDVPFDKNREHPEAKTNTKKTGTLYNINGR